jgi:Zn-dependent protease/CBS domain-containing protein
MSWSITLGRIAGTAVRIHFTFLIFLAWIGISAMQKGGTDAAIQNTAFMAALFLCVLLHEFGHILTARHFGIRTPDVVLLPIGGVASLERMPEKPSQELAVAVAGPLVNVAIALILIAFVDLPRGDLHRIEDPQISLLARLAMANIFLALFNMLPAYPMDGGRVLHALLSMRVGTARATQTSARVGQALALLLGFAGLFGNPMLIFIAIFIYMTAGGEAQESAFRSAITGLQVRDAMETRAIAISVEANLDEAVDLLLSAPQHAFAVVDGHDKPIGMLLREDILAGLQTRPRDSGVADIMRAPVPVLNMDAQLDRSLADLSASESQAISVVDDNGHYVGLLTRENLGEMMMIKALKPDWHFRHR